MTNELSNLHNNHSKTMSSKEIAELTGKRHDHVLRDIRALIEQGAITVPSFGDSTYTDASGKSNPMYLLDFEATMTLITGYDAVLRSKVIRRWKELETKEYEAKPQAPVQTLSQNKLLAEEFEGAKKLATLFGLEGNQALLKADKVIKRQYGISPMALLEIELKSPNNEALMIATEIGKKLNPSISAKSVNLLLADMKLQERVEYRTGKFEWRLTDRGKAYGSYLDTGKVHSDGTPIQQIKWKESVIPLIQQYLQVQG